MLPPGPSDAKVAYPLFSASACHAFLFLLGLLVCLCFCDRFVALSLLLFFFCPSCHMRPSIDTSPARSHTLPPMRSRSTPPLQRSESLFCGLLAPLHPTFVNRVARRLLLTPALGPRFAPKRPAESAKKLIGTNSSFPCELCGDLTVTHRGRFSQLSGSSCWTLATA